ncbi:PTS sugar transporter subunit IIB [Klebsiella quasipneumoniae subsp. similipneumoniae]|nr:PTS sugar transporter subunit IIB [Klebsiella quasipneumoniae]MDF3331777.1 PTS sugar transporter subunit IIB [Klebsiella quasipneumoniae subsp. similipneumoniae]
MIKLVRIDYRLLHGQVVFAWTRALDIDHIIVANAKAAADAFITMSLNLAKPAGVTLDIATVEQAAEKLNSGKLDHKKVMVVLGNTAETLALVEKIPEISAINYGGCHFQKATARTIRSQLHYNHKQIICLQSVRQTAP